jgi:hypothetical protein
LVFFNLQFCKKYSLEKKVITMRDILALMEFIVKLGQFLQKSGLEKFVSVEEELKFLFFQAISLVVVEPLGFLGLGEIEKAGLLQEV